MHYYPTQLQMLAWGSGRVGAGRGRAGRVGAGQDGAVQGGEGRSVCAAANLGAGTLRQEQAALQRQLVRDPNRLFFMCLIGQTRVTRPFFRPRLVGAGAAG